MDCIYKAQIGIIGAMKDEIESLKSKIADSQEITVSGVVFVYGTIYGVKIVAAMSGVGKVFAAVCAQTMALLFSPDYIINIGVGGSLTPELKIGDVAVASATVQHDMDTSAVGDPLGLISGINKVYFDCSEFCLTLLKKVLEEEKINYRTGVIASGDVFMKDMAKRQFIVDNFNAIVCEMEGASIAQVCYVNQIEYAVIRSISDSGDENSAADYTSSLIKAANVGLHLIDRFIYAFSQQAV